MMEPAFVELECSKPTASLEVVAREDHVVLTSRGKRGGALNIERLT